MSRVFPNGPEDRGSINVYKPIFAYKVKYFGNKLSQIRSKTGIVLKKKRTGCLFVWVLWRINLCRLFNAKFIFIQINSSTSNNSV